MQEAAVDFASDLKKKEKKEDKRVYTGGVRPTSHIGQQKSGATSQQGWKGKRREGEQGGQGARGPGQQDTGTPAFTPGFVSQWVGVCVCVRERVGV